MPNGKIVAPQRHPTWLSEVKGLVVALKMDPTVVFLFPLFLASNYFYTCELL